MPYDALRMDDYANRLNRAMEDARATPVALAKELGVSVQAVRKVLAGSSRAFTAANNANAASFLRVRPDWLATGEGAMRGIVQAASFGVRDQGTEIGGALGVLHAAIVGLDEKRLAELQKFLDLYLGDPQRHSALLKMIEDLLAGD